MQRRDRQRVATSERRQYHPGPRRQPIFLELGVTLNEKSFHHEGSKDSKEE
jgi:hypothetical protein